MTKEHLQTQKQTEQQNKLQQTVSEKKEAHRESGRKFEHQAFHLKDTENTKGHQFDPSRRTTNK